MANAFVITHGTAGDILPLLGVAAALAAEGHRVTVLTHSPYRRVVAEHGMAFVPIDTDAQYAAELAHTKRFNEDLFRRPMAVARFYEQINWFDQIRRELSTVLARHVPADTVVVARHTSGVSLSWRRRRWAFRWRGWRRGPARSTRCRSWSGCTTTRSARG